MARRRTKTGIYAALLALTSMLAVTAPATSTIASAAGAIAALPTDNPANWTPNVLDGEVDSIWQVGDRMLIAGTFTQVANATQNGGAVYRRLGIAAFDATTGVVDTGFAPVLNAKANVVVSAGDGASVYVGGDFTTVNGVSRRKLARINLANGSLVTAFNPSGLNGQVKDLKLANGVLYLGGSFTTLKAQTRTGLATVNPTTGAITNHVTVTLSGQKNGGTTGVYKFDISPAGDRLLLIGNFLTVAGQSRSQAAMLDLSTSPATVAPWNTTWYTANCANVFESYMRDIDISPDGAYAVISTTGAYRANQACDTQSRFEVYPATTVSPTWVNYTGGDTTYAVEIAGGVVFVGGHMRWANNPFAADAAGPGAVPREGMHALDPVTGLPFSWNPGRDRGVGLFDFFVTEAGVWAGSDTDRWANELRQRLAFFPFAGGTLVPANAGGDLPADIVLGGRTAGTVGTDSSVLHRINAGGPALSSVDDGPAWSADDSSSSTVHNAGSMAASYATGVQLFDATVPQSDTDRVPQALFSTERYDPAGGNEMQWTLPVAAGTPVQVRLYFANRSSSTNETGERIFDVDLEGVTVLDDLDLSGSVGHNVATMRSYDVTSDGSITVLFRHGAANNPLLHGIEIVRSDVSTAGSFGTQDDVQRRFYNGTAAVNPVVLPGTLAWHNARGAFMVNGDLFTMLFDGSMSKRTFDGTSFGPAQPVGTYANNIVSEAPNLTGMFFDPSSSRIYYALADDSNLYWRTFLPESGVLGAQRGTVTSSVAALDPSRVRGMLLSSGSIWFADATTGALMEVAFAGGAVSGTASVAENTMDWRARTMFISTAPPAPAPGPNTAPIAPAFAASCTFATCTFTDGGSTDVDGVIASYGWDFGDGATGSGSPVTHAFPGGGDYDVVLTVTDDDGAAAQRSALVHVQAAPNETPTATFTTSCSSLRCSLDAGSSRDDDGTIASYAWSFGDGGTATGATASHAFAAPGTYTVALTVTDDAGASASTSQAVAVEALAVAFRGSSSANSSGTNASVGIPASVQAGDQLVLFVTASVDTTITTPARWTLLGTQVDGVPDVRSWVFTRTAVAGLAGTDVVATLGSSAAKSSRILMAYSSASAPRVAASATAGPSTATHATPPVTVAGDGSLVVSYWSDKSAGNAGWTLPGTVTARRSSLGTGSGQITAAAGDTGPVDAGMWPGATATSSVASAKAIHWSVVIPSGRPSASSTSSCTGLACGFDGSGSADADGSIVSWAWRFGDGTSGTGATPTHTYSAAGTYQVELTVTDDDGWTGTTTIAVTAAPLPNQAPTAAFTPRCIGLDCSLDGSGSSDSDGSIVGYAWTFGDGSGSTAASPTHTYAAAGSYLVTLTVTDDGGASTELQKTVAVSATLVAFRAAGSANSAAANPITTIPAAVQGGDQLILIVTANADTTVSTPAGWTLLGTAVDGSPDMRSTVFTTTATATSAGSSVTTAFGSGSPKSSRIILAYSGAGVPTVAAFAVAGSSTATHATAPAAVDASGSWVLSYWSDKSAGNTGWSLPASVAGRASSIGSGTGSITAAVGDAGPLGSGTWDGATATSSVASAKAIHWSIVIPSA